MELISEEYFTKKVHRPEKNNENWTTGSTLKLIIHDLPVLWIFMILCEWLFFAEHTYSLLFDPCFAENFTSGFTGFRRNYRLLYRLGQRPSCQNGRPIYTHHGWLHLHPLPTKYLTGWIRSWIVKQPAYENRKHSNLVPSSLKSCLDTICVDFRSSSVHSAIIDCWLVSKRISAR